MASGGSDLSIRTSAEGQRLIREMALKLFKEHKIEISHAINTTFPFLEKLRDLGLITHEKYKESRKSCENMAPVLKVVYDVLNELEEKSHLSLLEILFSKVFMNHYPDLKGICKGFRDVIQKEICCQANDEEKDAKNHNIQLSLEQGTGENSCPSMSWLFLDQSNYTVIRSEASAKFDDGDKLALPQASTSALTREPESMDLTKSSTSGNTSCKRGPMDLGKPPTSQKAKKIRWSKNHEGEFVDFQSEILPVTCGEITGMLYKNKLKEGPREKCIETEDGNWFTPSEFSLKAGYQKSSHWKSTVRCGGKTIKKLIEEGKFATWPKEQGKETQLEKPEACEICQNGEDLFGCDTCSRFFHGDCHLPSVDTKRRPWSCTFCRIKESSGSQQCHGEWEVLARPMGPEEQLKCEFLLLAIYCHSDSISLEQMQQDMYSVEAYRCMNNFMMLNKIKRNLNERRYLSVDSFMRDMRLIFQNHRAFNKDHALYLMGINLEEEFEQNFKKVFAIQ